MIYERKSDEKGSKLEIIRIVSNTAVEEIDENKILKIN